MAKLYILLVQFVVSTQGMQCKVHVLSLGCQVVPSLALIQNWARAFEGTLLASPFLIVEPRSTLITHFISKAHCSTLGVAYKLPPLLI